MGGGVAREGLPPTDEPSVKGARKRVVTRHQLPAGGAVVKVALADEEWPKLEELAHHGFSAAFRQEIDEAFNRCALDMSAQMAYRTPSGNATPSLTVNRKLKSIASHTRALMKLLEDSPLETQDIVFFLEPYVDREGLLRVLRAVLAKSENTRYTGIKGRPPYWPEKNLALRVQEAWRRERNTTSKGAYWDNVDKRHRGPVAEIIKFLLPDVQWSVVHSRREPSVSAALEEIAPQK